MNKADNTCKAIHATMWEADGLRKDGATLVVLATSDGKPVLIIVHFVEASWPNEDNKDKSDRTFNALAYLATVTSTTESAGEHIRLFSSGDMQESFGGDDGVDILRGLAVEIDFDTSTAVLAYKWTPTCASTGTLPRVPEYIDAPRYLYRVPDRGTGVGEEDSNKRVRSHTPSRSPALRKKRGSPSGQPLGSLGGLRTAA